MDEFRPFHSRIPKDFPVGVQSIDCLFLVRFLFPFALPHIDEYSHSNLSVLQIKMKCACYIHILLLQWLCVCAARFVCLCKWYMFEMEINFLSMMIGKEKCATCISLEQKKNNQPTDPKRAQKNCINFVDSCFDERIWFGSVSFSWF